MSAGCARGGQSVAALLVCALLSGGGLAAAAPTPSTTATTAAAAGGDWTVYHGDGLGDGAAPSITAVDTGSPAWTSPALQGDLYGEPLVFEGQVFVATENDTVDALSAATGAIDWSAHVGTPVSAADLPCGDISPTVGITGTPVIDPGRAEVFVVADELMHGKPSHVLVGLSTASGQVELSQAVDPAGADPAALLQRTGLTLDQGRVVFGMGGNYGDCSSYRGRVISVPEAGGQAEIFTVDGKPGQSQGAVWMGGAAPVVDAAGNVWVSAGNGSVVSSSEAYDDSDSLLELSPSMTLLQYFAPSDWPANNAADLDMPIAPVLLPDGHVIVAGKSRIVYLLNGSALGGIGKQEAALPAACGDDIDGGVAFEGSTAFLPCLSGTIAVRATDSPPGLHLLWRSDVGGGPPILAGGLVWTMGQDGNLYGLNPATGALQHKATVGSPANHFPTPSVGGGLLLAASAEHVVAFPARSAGSPTPPTVTSAPSATTTTATASVTGSTSSAWIWLVVVGAVVVGVGAAIVWALRKRRRREA
jgi:polyvinyl alcohol dehydrogenase (cytochrome)